ncbi:MAG: transglycosylase domain-containing protein [Microthrixaceae bacterium]|nr:transglycosylase domain-containing protein [Microthrixaceae bacterium]
MTKSAEPTSKAIKEPKPRRARPGWRVWIRRLMFAGVLVGVATVGVGFVLLNSVEIPDPTRTIKTTSFVCTAEVSDGACTPSNSVAQFSQGGNNRVLVNLDEVSPHLINAVVAAEDRSFFTHGGVDPWGIARALYRDLRGSASRQGGSTITQQYVKQVYLTADRTPERKLKEAAIAIKLERKLSKPEILERYLNEVYLGRGAIGVEAASRAYFDKDAKDLDIAESAYLAGLIRAPKYADEPSDPDNPQEAKEAKRRRQTVLDAMVEEQYITAEQAADAASQEWAGHVLEQAPATAGPVVRSGFSAVGGRYIIEWVRTQLRDMPNVGEKALLEQGLRVYLTIDPRLQLAAHGSTVGVLNQPDDPASALVSVDDSGRIVAMIGGQNFDASQVNYALGAAGGGTGRQAGSTFKPIALAEYVAQGHSVKSNFWGPKLWVFPKLNDGKDWEVKNYDDKEFAETTVEQATWQSANTIYAQMMLKITPEKFAAMAARLGITAPVKPVPAAVLGTADVSVLDMATAYSTFANSGTLKPPYIIRRVEAADGSVLYDVAADPAKQPTPEAIPVPVAETVNSVLSGVIGQPVGSGHRAQLRTKAAGKTGTTSDYRDAWFAGYTCRITTVVWMGYDNKPGEPPRYMDKVHGKEVTGGSLPADIWRSFMATATEGARGCSFKPVDAGLTIDPPDPAYAPTTTTIPAAPIPGAPVDGVPAPETSVPVTVSPPG